MFASSTSDVDASVGGNRVPNPTAGVLDLAHAVVVVSAPSLDSMKVRRRL